jgi:hypothetical protein
MKNVKWAPQPVRTGSVVHVVNRIPFVQSVVSD